MYFTKIMRSFVRHLSKHYGNNMLSSLYDFLVAASPSGPVVTAVDRASARRVLRRLFHPLGFVRNVKKACWDGSRQLDHLGKHLYTTVMRVSVSDGKMSQLRQLGEKLLLRAQLNRHRVSLEFFVLFVVFSCH